MAIAPSTCHVGECVTHPKGSIEEEEEMKFGNAGLIGRSLTGLAMIWMFVGSRPAMAHDHDMDDCELTRVQLTPLAAPNVYGDPIALGTTE